MAHTARFERVTGLFLFDLEADFVPHVGTRVAVVIDGSTPQVTTLVQVLRDWKRGGSHLSFSDPVVVPQFRPTMSACVLDEHGDRIGSLDVHVISA